MDYLELAEDYRHTKKYKDLYEKRKETIERVFADAKEKHSMRYTLYRGLTQVIKWGKLKFACMNLKKMALHIQKNHHLLWIFKIIQYIEDGECFLKCVNGIIIQTIGNNIISFYHTTG